MKMNQYECYLIGRGFLDAAVAHYQKRMGCSPMDAESVGKATEKALGVLAEDVLSEVAGVQ